MPVNSFVHAEVDARLLEQASEIYAAAGLTPEEAFRLMLMRTVADHSMPLDLLVPNGESVQAMLAARRGELVAAGSIEGLLNDLHADD